MTLLQNFIVVIVTVFIIIVWVAIMVKENTTK
jgi:hypothetical protein